MNFKPLFIAHCLKGHSPFLSQILQQIPYMGGGFYLSVFFHKDTFFIDDECGSFDTHVLSAVHALFLQHAVKIDHLFLFIRKKGEIQFILIPEIAVFLIESRLTPRT